MIIARVMIVAVNAASHVGIGGVMVGCGVGVGGCLLYTSDAADE